MLASRPSPSSASVALAVAVAVSALGVAGCGGNAKKPLDARAKVRVVVTRYGVAVARKDYAQICQRLIDQNLSDNVEELGLPCEQAFKQGLGAVKGAKLRIDDVKVATGDRVAFVKVHTTAVGQPASDDTLKLVLAGADWRISSLSAANDPAAAAAATKDAAKGWAAAKAAAGAG